MDVKYETNSKSIVSLILGILSIFIPFAGLILGVIGIVLSRKATREIVMRDENGKGLAVAGLTCSIVGVGLQILLILLYLLFFILFSVDTFEIQ